jgi:hypothetical protein
VRLRDERVRLRRAALEPRTLAGAYRLRVNSVFESIAAPCSVPLCACETPTCVRQRSAREPNAAWCARVPSSMA